MDSFVQTLILHIENTDPIFIFGTYILLISSIIWFVLSRVSNQGSEEIGTESESESENEIEENESDDQEIINESSEEKSENIFDNISDENKED